MTPEPTPPEGGSSSWPWIAALLGIGAAYHGLVVLARGYLFFGDTTTLDHPAQVFLRECLRSGHLPMWNPYIYGGFPQFAEGQVAALYPLNLLAALLVEAHVGITWMVVLHRLLAGVFMFLLARAWGMRRSSAFVAGLVFMFSGFLFSHSMNWGLSASSAYLPLVLCFLEMGLQKRRVIYAVPAGITLALQFLLAYPPVTYLSMLAGGAYLLLRALALGARRTLPLAAGLFAGAVALGVALGAVQILPTLELAGRSARTGHPLMDRWGGITLGREGLTAFLAPDTWGSPAYGNYRGSWEYCGYLGLLPLGLAVVGAAGRFRRTWVLAVMAGAAVALSTGVVPDPVTRGVRLATGADMFRVPIRYLLVTTVSLSLLAGAGYDRLSLRLRRSGGSWPWLLACGGLVVVWAALTFLVLSGPARYSLSARYTPLAPVAVGLLAICAVAVIAVAWRGGLSRAAFGGLVVALILADLLPWGATQMPTVDGSYFTRPPKAAKVIARDHGWYRMATWRPVSAPYWATQFPTRRTKRDLVEGMLPNIPECYGIRSIEGYSALFPRRQRALIAEMSRIVDPRLPPDMRVLNAAGVKYVIAMEPIPDALTRGLDAIHFGPGPWVYRNDAALGPCWVVPRAVILGESQDESRDAAGELMASAAFDPAKAPIVEQDGGPGLEPLSAPEGFRGEARALRLERTEMEFEARASGPSLLVVNAAAYDPGWTATVDGRRAHIYAANQMFQAVRLPPGRHRVVMRYRPATYLVGRVVSLSAAMAILVGLAWRRARPFRIADPSGP